MLRHELSRNFFGWVAYTLSRSELKDKPLRDWRLFEYDQTHILTMVAQYKVPWHLPFREWARNGRLPRGIWWNMGWAILAGDFSVGGRFRLVSGNPTTFYELSSHDLDRDAYVGEAGLQNGKRLPLFHQLDLRVDYKMAFDNWLLTVFVDVINVYNRKNAEFIEWDYRYRTFAPLAVLPLLPVGGIYAEF